MKLSKKVLAAFSVAAALAMVGTLAGCTEEDDDTEGAITGSGKNYSINYTNNSGTDIYRCWNTTTFKHEGELVKVVINNQSSSTKDGNMGFVWDLCQSKDAANPNSVTLGHTEKGYRNFFVIGAQNNSGTIRYYISKYFNVTDLQADNFGASKIVTSHDAGIAATDPVEIAVQSWTNLSDAKIASDGTVTLWFDIYSPVAGKKYGVPYAETAATESTGIYYVDIYDADPTDSTVTAKKIGTNTIESSVTGYSAEPKQNTLAVYANVQPSKTLNGAWNLAKDYAADEVVEE
ncbi:MAG: hypothetical protein IJ630_09040 [Treponema sp.]|nr:hypothetical protein [Treponema sp.]